MNMLTLRYNPCQEPIISRLTADDFRDTKIVSTDKVSQLLKNIIYKNLDGDHFTIALSGGIDSTLVLTLTRELFPDAKIDCLCAMFSGYSEYEYAEIIARRFDCNLHSVYIEDVLSELPMQISIVEEPRWNIYMYYVVKHAKKYSNILLTGDGGDELFGGYTFRYSKFLNLLDTNDTWKERAMKYLECHERDWVPDQKDVFGPKVSFDWNYILELLKPYFNNDLEPLLQVFLADFNGKLLFDWLPANTKIYNHFGIKGVSPFLDEELIHLASRIDPTLKFDKDNNIGKIILRRLLEKYGISINGEKTGFVLNTKNVWLQYKKILRYYLEDARVVNYGWINREWIMKIFKTLETNDLNIRYINKILGIFAFEIWYRLFVTKEMKPYERI